MKKEIVIAHIVDAVDEAYVCIDAALRFATYIMEDNSEEKLPGFEEELKNAQKWIVDSVKYVALLKGRLEEKKGEPQRLLYNQSYE